MGFLTYASAGCRSSRSAAHGVLPDVDWTLDEGAAYPLDPDPSPTPSPGSSPNPNLNPNPSPNPNLTLTHPNPRRRRRVQLVCISLEAAAGRPLRASCARGHRPLFESLRIGGREVGAPGPVKGRYITLPAAPPSPRPRRGRMAASTAPARTCGDTPLGLDPDKLPGMP